MTPNIKGALLMSGAMAAFTLNDTLVKLVTQTVPLFQMIFLRGLLTAIMMVALLRWMGQLRFHIPPVDRGKVIGRILAEIAAMITFMIALIHMPLANVAAILAALPLSVTLVAFLVFREPVGWRRMLAITVGFAGVMLIVKPGGEGFTIYSIYALMTVGFVTIRDLLTRRLSPEAPSMGVAFITAIAVGLSGGVLSISEDWQPINMIEATYIIGAAICIIGGYLFSIMTMRVGEIGVVAPFRYTALVWALILGFFVFGDWPDLLTLIGAAIVVASGIFTLLREHRVARRAERLAASLTATAVADAPISGPSQMQRD
ncbi:DMT family transporter [Roseobacter sp. HKCCD7870]|uniref:DMT family transporter n=1 Tax=Roseobacter sp. HKCCD7870 TaxID=3120343 RepID=UPI0030EECCE5